MIRFYFGLSRNPFDAESVSLLPHQQEVFDILRVHAQQGGLCLVLGEPGTGKSVIKQSLLNHDTKRMITPVVNGTLHTYHNTLRILFEDFPPSHNLVLIAQPPLMQSIALSVNEEIRSRITYSVVLPRLAPETIEASVWALSSRASVTRHAPSISSKSTVSCFNLTGEKTMTTPSRSLDSSQAPRPRWTRDQIREARLSPKPAQTRTANRKGYDTNEEHSTMRAWLDGDYTGDDLSRRMRTIKAWLLGNDLPSQLGNIADIPTVGLQPFLRSQLSPQHLAPESRTLKPGQKNKAQKGGADRTKARKGGHPSIRGSGLSAG